MYLYLPFSNYFLFKKLSSDQFFNFFKKMTEEISGENVKQDFGNINYLHREKFCIT